jgi:hypothetical protein
VKEKLKIQTKTDWVILRRQQRNEKKTKEAGRSNVTRFSDTDDKRSNQRHAQINLSLKVRHL